MSYTVVSTAKTSTGSIGVCSQSESQVYIHSAEPYRSYYSGLYVFVRINQVRYVYFFAAVASRSFHAPKVVRNNRPKKKITNYEVTVAVVQHHPHEGRRLGNLEVGTRKAARWTFSFGICISSSSISLSLSYIISI